SVRQQAGSSVCEKVPQRAVYLKQNGPLAGGCSPLDISSQEQSVDKKSVVRPESDELLPYISRDATDGHSLTLRTGPPAIGLLCRIVPRVCHQTHGWHPTRPG